MFLTESELKAPTHCITNALKSVHKQDFLHNDLQPCNIFMHHSKADNFTYVKLSGFSKCQPIDTEHLDFLNPSYELEGQNILIKAPEVLVSGGKQTSTSSDVWSLGVMVYALGCGRLPFKTVGAILETPLSWSAYETAGIKASMSFKSLITAMLHKNAKHRPRV